jgi:hypothetical protein
VSPNYSRRREEKTRKGDNDETGERDRKRRRKNDAKEDDDEADPITDFLLKEGLVKSVKILEVGNGTMCNAPSPVDFKCNAL